MTTNNYLVSIVKKSKRVGRGIGSGRGKTAGRGTKGQKARKSGHTRPLFEGGQTPISRRFPKRGPKRSVKSKKIPYQIINLDSLEKNEKLISGNLVDFSGEKFPVKILGRGELTKNLNIKVSFFSASAQKKIVEAGGSFQIVEK